ncbi:cupin domain-containing protein [Promicromonospora panici]|uniref:cupin domain-containing protein n=1 Tax=Promicromonospora panici TaxID=2219658 RepID=UPI001F5C2B44|nr:cupin domain-containing protein [Promicromonospora panici]
MQANGETRTAAERDADGLFMVVSGVLTIQLRDRDVVLGPNDVFVVLKGVEHCPKADTEMHALLSSSRER